jgi:stearoyl-CoA desaturase (delta-9 desaturase)
LKNSTAPIVADALLVFVKLRTVPEAVVVVVVVADTAAEAEAEATVAEAEATVEAEAEIAPTGAALTAASATSLSESLFSRLEPASGQASFVLPARLSRIPNIRISEMLPNIPTNRINWFTSGFLIVTFFVAVIGTPWYFIQFGVDWFLVGMFAALFLATGMSITLGYHRLFAHKAFRASKPVKLLTLLFGAAAFEDSALDWASDHREHHKHVDDEEDDPYSITKGFFWAHMGWIFFKLYPRELTNVGDLKRDPLVMWQHRHHRLIGVLIGLVLPTVLGALHNGAVGALGGFLIGGVARLVAVQHSTFFINSLCHTIGTRPYDSETSARDSALMALFTFGEGYHNYHHSFQHDYRNGVKPWQWDPTKWAIWCLERVGLASDLRRVSEEKIVLAELRETQSQVEAHLNRSSSWSISTPSREAAMRRLSELTDQLSEG